MTEQVTIQAVEREYDRLKSGHWFSPANMRFFSSRLMWEAYRVTDEQGTRYYFVSSERPPYDEREYTVRCMRLCTDGDGYTIDNVSTQGQYASRNGAIAAMRKVVGV